MPIDEIKAGMVGVGRTVFQGTAIEEFKAHIIGVIRSNVGPRRDLILARLEGGPLAKTGVIAGMSGSPVYIDGRLVGAVSYSLGAFATEPIAGITPIAEIDRRDDPDVGGHDGTERADSHRRRSVGVAALVRVGAWAGTTIRGGFGGHARLVGGAGRRVRLGAASHRVAPRHQRIRGRDQ
jgi:hypothetical protein